MTMNNDMLTKLTKSLLALLLPLSILAGSCGGRHLPGAPDGSTSKDGAVLKKDSSTIDASVQPRSCTTNMDCKSNVDPSKSGYCFFASGCGETGPGTCKPLPEECTADCPGVCGCDGKTYCNACMAASMGISVSHQGACTPYPGCATNADCPGGNEYCHIEKGCVVTGAKMGTCKPRPTSCPTIYSPTCGCDGKTYGNPCAANAKGVNVKHAGACGSSMTCADIEKAYIAEVKANKSCCLVCAALQCQYKVNSQLVCPCPTFINSPATAKMTTLEQQWNAQNCGYDVDCAPCAPVNYAICANTSGGVCQDQYGP